MRFINRKIVLLILSLFLVSLQTKAQENTFDDSILSEKGRQAYQKLLSVEFFEQGGMGYGGESSDGTNALRVLLNEEKGVAILAFKSLAKNASIAGGLYGLLGLKDIKCDCFQQEAEKFRLIRTSEADKESLRYESGCVLHLKLEGKEKKDFIEELFSYWIRRN